MEISIKMEFIALIILAILFLFHWDRQSSSSTRYKIFTIALLISAAMIVLDMASTWAIDAADIVPGWVNVFLSTMYFISLDLTFSIIAFYCFYIMFEHASDRHCFYIASGITILFIVTLMVFNVLNLWTGWIFRFEGNVYVRGPLNKIVFVPMLIEVGMFCVCYMRNRDIVGNTLKHLVQTLPPVVVMIAVVQTLIPDTILSGMLAALVCMLLFINFQSSRNGRDSLTGLANRTNFTQELRARKKRGQNLHLILIYLEKYEDINKKYGVKQGDSILFQIAAYLDRKIPGYNVCRFGNTTFLLMGKETDDAVEKRCVDNIKKRFEAPWTDGESGAVVNVSIAHRSVDFSDCDIDTAIDQLEYTLSCIRESGGNAVRKFDQELRYRYERKEYVLGKVKKAIENESFEMYYQPLYDCKEKRFRTAESLIRLPDVSGSFISPAEFIPLAEKNGLMEEISRIVLKKVCGFIGNHENIPIDQVSINMSIQQLTDPKFVEQIRSICKGYAIPAEKLRIEITERTMAEEPKIVKNVMEELSKEGVAFYLDDFGIGYSNLAMMMEMPFETVKLDSSLLTNLVKDGKHIRSVKLLVEFMHQSGFLVVAEGIETIKQNEIAKSLGIDMIQGYYHARPMPEDRLVEFMMEKQQD